MDSFVRVVKEELREGSTDDDEILCKGLFYFSTPFKFLNDEKILLWSDGNECCEDNCEWNETNVNS